jgi:hypothetical protein
MKIGFFGDIHYNYDLFIDFLNKLKKLNKIDIAIQAGDFGFSKNLIEKINLNRPPIPLYAIDGNHEDFNFLNKASGLIMLNELRNSGFYYQKRGSVINLCGCTIGFIGGALNIDKSQKLISGNVITENDLYRTINTFNLFMPDIIVSHSCPSSIGIGIKGNPNLKHGIYNYIVMEGFDPGPENDPGETRLAMLWNELHKKPSHWIFAHFHKFHQKKLSSTTFSCIPAFRDSSEFIIFDTEYANISIEYIENI